MQKRVVLRKCLNTFVPHCRVMQFLHKILFVAIFTVVTYELTYSKILFIFFFFFFWYCSLIYSVQILSASIFWPVTQHKYVFMTAFLLLLFVVSVSKDLKVPVSTVIERELQKLLGNKDLKQFNSDFLERHSRSLLHRLSGNDRMFVCNFLLFSDLSSFETRGFPQRFMAYVTQT